LFITEKKDIQVWYLHELDIITLTKKGFYLLLCWDIQSKKTRRCASRRIAGCMSSSPYCKTYINIYYPALWG